MSPLIFSSMIILEKKGKQFRKFLKKNNIVRTASTKALCFLLKTEAKNTQRKELKP